MLPFHCRGFLSNKVYLCGTNAAMLSEISNPRSALDYNEETLISILDQIQSFMPTGASKAYTQQSLRLFADLPQWHKEQVFLQFQAWRFALEIIPFREKSGQAEASRMKHTMNFMRFKVSDEFFNLVKENDIVEGYLLHPEHGAFQIYRNGAFRETCSYDPLQLTTQPMHKLFSRTESVQKTIEDRFAKLFADGTGKPYMMDVEDHEIVEILHPRQRKFRIKNRFLALLFQGDRPVGVASTLIASPEGSLLDGLRHVTPIV